MAMEPTHPAGLTAETPEPPEVATAREVLAASKAAYATGDPVDPARWWGRLETALELLLAHIDGDQDGDEGAEQPDPNACITCGRDFTAGRSVIPNVPVGRVDGVLMFACVGCTPETEDGPDESDVPAPDEGDEVAQMAENLLVLADRGPLVRRHADAHRADYPDVAAALDVTANAHDRLRAALDHDGDVSAAVEDIRAASATARQACRAARMSGDAQGARP